MMNILLADYRGWVEALYPYILAVVAIYDFFYLVGFVVWMKKLASKRKMLWRHIINMIAIYILVVCACYEWFFQINFLGTPALNISATIILGIFLASIINVVYLGILRRRYDDL